jgi:hypothetical protein
MTDSVVANARKKKTALLTRTQREEARLEQESKAPAAPAAADPVRKAPAQEAIGTGRSDARANFDRLVAPLVSDEANARKTGNIKLADKLATRIAAMKEQLSQAT